MQSRVQRRWILTGVKPVLAVVGILIYASKCAHGEETVAKLTPVPHGVEHVLYLSVKPDPSSPLLTQANRQEAIANLTVTLRISAHSQETNFFGLVPATISKFNLVEGSKEQAVWRDGKCHHERGFPKISVTSIDGLVTIGQQKYPVNARWRVIGLFLPGDEITTSRRIGNSADKIGSYIGTRTETKQSRLFVDLKLYVLQCDLTVTAQQTPAGGPVNR
jgi:hypothetical protein